MLTFIQATKGRKNSLITAFSYVIKITVVAVAFIFIYNKVLINHNIEDVFLHYEKLLTVVPFLLFILIIILMVLNWSIEALKWKYSIRRFEQISFLKSVEAVLSGVTISIAAPNRTGEFAGRIFHLNKLNKAQAAMLAIIASFSQLAVTINTGALCAVILFFYYPEILPFSYPQYMAVGGIVSIASLFVFFNINKVPFLLRLSRFKRFLPFFGILKKLTFKDLLTIFLLSAFRYFVFSFQFYTLIFISGVNVSFISGMSLISVIYLIMTFIPTTIISELPVRGSVAVAVFALVSDNNLAIANASFILWVINLMIPALFGSIFLFKAKLFKSPAFA